MGLDVTGKFRYPDPDPDWLAQLVEPIIDPALPIIDAHHHLWEEPGKRYLVDDLLADLGTGHAVNATVFAQCHYGYRNTGPEHLRPVGETERIATLATECASGSVDVCAGIIAFADLLDETHLEELLDAHATAAQSRLCGIRQSVARDDLFPDGVVLRPAPRGMLSDVRFRRSIRRIAGRGLVFDAMVYHAQLPELSALAAAIGEATIVLDHIGCILGVGPYRGRERETFEIWRRDVRALAALPNVYVKFGGLGMIVTGAEYHHATLPPTSSQLAHDWKPYFETCIEYFGPKRFMFESNFPVDKAMMSYPVLWNAYKRLAAEATATQKNDMFSNTAARVYRLTSTSRTDSANSRRR